MRWSKTVIVCLSVLMMPKMAFAQDPIASRKEAWQKVLDRRKFRFDESSFGVLYSISQFRADCEVHVIFNPKKRDLMTFSFVRDGKDFLRLEGHTGSAFRTVDNVMFFAHLSSDNPGCTVTAHDMSTGKKLWETKLSAVGESQHSAYINRVTMGVSKSEKKKGEGIVSITGREAYGDYVEILDQETGTMLAHKIYRQGFFGELKEKK